MHWDGNVRMQMAAVRRIEKWQRKNEKRKKNKPMCAQSCWEWWMERKDSAQEMTHYLTFWNATRYQPQIPRSQLTDQSIGMGRGIVVRRSESLNGVNWLINRLQRSTVKIHHYGGALRIRSFHPRSGGCWQSMFVSIVQSLRLGELLERKDPTVSKLAM